MGIILIPWQMICLVHPFGHKHLHHDEPSPCELHRIAAQQSGQHILPPMKCNHILSEIDDFQQPHVEKVVPTFHTFVIFAIQFNFVNFNNQEQLFLFPPDPQCRSATVISDNQLRGPPLV